VRRAPFARAEIAEPYAELVSQLGVVEAAFANLSIQNDAIEALARRAGEMRAELAQVLEATSLEYVYWFEVRGRGAFLWASPIRIGDVLRERLFTQVHSVILTSATLATGGNFQFIRARLGLEETDELILGSHFDFTRQAILYIPRDIPEPRDAGWARHACLEIEKILEASRGRAFVLFTSYAQMQTVRRALEGRLPFPMLMQGEKSKTGLLEEFRATPNAVLFATASFWQGVDVAGEQLSCVVIDKLPFSVPSDPVVEARIRHLNEAGGNAFYEYQVPEAVILLKQGFGRLIRSRADRGILALLDRRVVTRSYGRTFLASLPPAPATHDPAALRAFFETTNPS